MFAIPFLAYRKLSLRQTRKTIASRIFPFSEIFSNTNITTRHAALSLRIWNFPKNEYYFYRKISGKSTKFPWNLNANVSSLRSTRVFLYHSQLAPDDSGMLLVKSGIICASGWWRQRCAFGYYDPPGSNLNSHMIPLGHATGISYFEIFPIRSQVAQVPRFDQK